jgi:hypothetical protein
VTINVFGFECGTSGAAVILVREPITPLCMNDAEVDWNIKLLKENLDAVALKMKKAILEQAKKPDF